MKLRHIFVAVAAVAIASAAVADDNKTVTTVSYVTSAVSGKQTALSGANGSAVLYGNAAGQMGARAIVTTAASFDSESASSNKLVQNGVVVSKLNGKQNNITAPQNTAVTYGAAAGNLGSKDIYQASGAYSSKTQSNLAQADHVNSAVQSAMRAHMICNSCDDANYTSNPTSCPATSCLLWDVKNNLAGVYMPQNQS